MTRLLCSSLLLFGLAGCQTYGADPNAGLADESTETDTGDPPPSCQPLVQDCPGGEACYPLGNTFDCAPTTPEAGGFADPCIVPTDCGIGLTCGPEVSVGCSDGLGCCTYLCELDDDLACGGGLECRELFQEERPDVGPVGLCVPITS